MKKAIFTFGRFNPPTHGHGKVFDYLKRAGTKAGADVWVFISPSQDNKKNPLTHAERARAIKVAFPTAYVGMETKLITKAIDELIAKGYQDITLYGGEDRAASFDSIAKYYNKTFEGKVQLHIAAVPRPQGAISATVARDFALRGKLDQFLASLHPNLRNAEGKRLYDIIRSRMALKEALFMRSFAQFTEDIKPTNGQSDAGPTPEEQEKIDEPATVVIDPPEGMPPSKLHLLPKEQQHKLTKDGE